MFNNFSKLVRVNFLVAVFLLLLFSVYRLIFWLTFTDTTSLSNDLLYAFYLGLKFDWRLAILVVLPILLLGWIKPLNPLKNNIAKLGWHIYLCTIIAFITIFYFIDFGHYAYLKTHLNKTALRFLEDLDIASTMVWQSYPVIWISLLFVVLIFIFHKIIRKIFAIISKQSEYQLKLFAKIAINATITILILGSLMAKISWYPLRWSDAYFSDNGLIANVAQNPVLYGFDTMRYADINYDVELTKAHYERISKYLKLDSNKSSKALNYTRELQLTPKITQNLNVIMVFLESFAGYKTGTYGNPLNSSPHFDKLVKQSLFFDRFYVAHTGTARSVFANVTGLIDVQLLKTATRNPLIVNQNTIVNAFTGYDKFYFLGGSANWGNIRGVLQKNIHDLTIYEEGNYTSKSQDVWGISDADLFLEASKVLKKQKQPFVAFIQTSGNHRPYTIPKPDYGFKLLDSDEAEVKKYGFESLEELNSFRFMDHSIGLFIKQAKIDGYYDNSVFVFYADHGISGNNGLHQKPINSQLNIGRYHVPLVIHAPKFIKPSINSTIASHIDMLPIVAGLMNKKYSNNSLGRNMLALKYQNQQFAFFIEHGVVPKISLISKNFLFTMNSDNSHAQLFDLRVAGKAVDVSKTQAETSKSMQELTQAIHQTSKYLLYNNSAKASLK